MKTRKVSKPKLFEGHLKEMGKLGVREIRELTMPFPESIARELGDPELKEPNASPRERAKDKDIDIEPEV
jgi:hypothetical protein